MINELKYGQTWKIWPSPLGLSLYKTFKTCYYNLDNLLQECENDCMNWLVQIIRKRNVKVYKTKVTKIQESNSETFENFLNQQKK